MTQEQPTFSKKVRTTYDLMELLEYMESQGFMSTKRYVEEMVNPSHNFANDIHLDMVFDEGDDEEINRYHAEVRKLLNIDYEEHVLMRVCW